MKLFGCRQALFMNSPLTSSKHSDKYWGLELVLINSVGKYSVHICEVEVNRLIDSLSLSVLFFTLSFCFPMHYLLRATSILLALGSQHCRGTFSILDMKQRWILEQRPWFYIKCLATCAKYLADTKLPLQYVTRCLLMALSVLSASWVPVWRHAVTQSPVHDANVTVRAEYSERHIHLLSAAVAHWQSELNLKPILTFNTAQIFGESKSVTRTQELSCAESSRPEADSRKMR